MYTPVNASVLISAFSGALAGMGVSDRVPTDPVAADYSGLSSVAFAFAQSFDTLYSGPAGSYELQAITQVCETAWQSRAPQATSTNLLPATYSSLCQALIAIVTSGGTLLAAQGVPNPGIGACISWRPDGLGDVTTFEQVVAFIGASKCPVKVWTPQQTLYVIEPGPADPAVVYDLHDSWFEAPNGPHDAVQIQIRRNATLHDLSRIKGGLRLQASKQAGDPPALSFTPGATRTFVVEDGAELKNLGSATDIVLLVPDTATIPEFYLVFNQLGTAQADGGYPVVYAGPGSALRIVALSGGLSVDTIQPPNWVGGDATAAVSWVHDGTMAIPNPSFWDNTGTGYFPALLSTLTNEPTGLVGAAGPLANRPIFQGGGLPSLGCQYFASDYAVIAPLGSYIAWDGANWRDTAGTIVP